MAQALSSEAFTTGNFKSQDGLTRGVRISKGLDRLKFGFYVEFGKPLLFEILAEAKERAQETRQVIPLQLGMEDHFFYNCHANGKKGGYAFHISRADVDIFISGRKDWMETPNVWVRLRFLLVPRLWCCHSAYCRAAEHLFRQDPQEFCL